MKNKKLVIGIISIVLTFLLVACDKNKIDENSNINSGDANISINSGEPNINNEGNENFENSGVLELINVLKDENWLQENVSLKSNRFGSILESNDQQLYFLPVLNKNYVIVEAVSEEEYSAQAFVVFYNDGKINVISPERMPRNTVIDDLISVDTNANVLSYSSISQGAYTDNYYKFDNSGIVEITVFTHLDEENMGNDFQRDYLINNENVDAETYEKRKEDFVKQFNFEKITIELTDTNVDAHIK